MVSRMPGTPNLIGNVKPPTEWADLMPAERQVWIDRADMAIAMVFQEFGESPFDAEPLDAN